MESIVRVIVSNRSFTLLFFLIIGIAAWIQLPTIKVSQYPVVKLPMLQIEATLPGASAREIEQTIINPIEDKLQNTRNLDEFTSNVYNSFALVNIGYDYGVDIDDEYVDINAKINNIKSDFPEGAEVTVLKQSPVDLIVTFVIGLASETATLEELTSHSATLVQRLRKVDGIEEINEIYPDQEVRIDLNLARLETHQLDINTITSTIRANNQYLPTGTFNIGDRSVSVLAFGEGYRDLEQLRDTMVINKEGDALALRDVATVSQVLERDPVIATVDGAPAVLLTMKLAEDGNIFEAKAQIDQALSDAALPDGMSAQWIFDAAEGVDYKLRELGANILLGILILTVILLFSVGIRSSLIIAATLPAALFLSVVGLSFTEYGIQEISLAGFIIALGLIVDNGIVVTENAYKLNHYGGLSHEEAAIKGTSAVVMPLFSSTATTALAFAPLYLLTSVTGLFLHSLVAVIWLCLASSLVAAIVISSFMISRMGTENRAPFLPSPPSFLIALIPFRDRFYRRTLEMFIRRPVLVVPLVAALLGAAYWAVSQLPVIVFPDSEEPFFTVVVEAPRDRSGESVQALLLELQDQISAEEPVQLCASVSAGSFPYVNTGLAQVASRRNNGQIFCSVDFRNAQRMETFLESLNEKLAVFGAEGDIEASAFAVGGTGAIADVEVEIYGPRIDQVRDTAGAIESYLREAGIEGVASIDNEAVSRHFAVNFAYRERVANALGVSRASVDQVLGLITFGHEIDELRDDGGDNLPIVLRAETNTEDPLNLLDRVFVSNDKGARVPLSQVVNMSFVADEFDIRHSDFRPMVKIDVTAAPGHSVAKLTDDVQAAVDAFDLPPGMTINYFGQIADTADAFGGMGKYVGIVSLVILAIFVFQFGSIVQPLIIFAAIPLSFIGAFLLLYLMGQPMSFLAFIGMTSLMGIVINNSILLVDEGNQLRSQQPELSIAAIAIEAGASRFMPIVLTSVTSIAGLLPLALGESMFKPLAIVVIGGLATSTVLTLICLPVLYTLATRRGTSANRVTGDWNGHSQLGESPLD